jgi:hypothetical protein
MEQNEFLEKLSLVADWEYREVKVTTPVGLKQPADLKELQTPKELIITKIKPCPCPYKQEFQGCSLKINWWSLKTYATQRKIRVVRCETCNHVITPKGNFADAKDVQNLAYFIAKVDRES